MALKARARRIYADVVRGRTSVRVAQPVLTTGEPPVFLTGAYRSGTTLLRLVIDSHSRLASPPETMFLRELAVAAANPASGFAELGFDEAHVLSRIREFTEYFYASYAASRGKARWVDKSPEYVWQLPWLARVFPDAKFVLLSRYSLDQVASHVASGHAIGDRLAPFREDASEDIRVTATRYWAQVVARQRELMEQMPDRCHAIRYEDVCRTPESALSPLFEFLGEPWEPDVLDFNRQRHDFGRADDKARSSRTFSFSTGAHQSWPVEVRDACLRIARESSEWLGWLEPPRAAEIS